MSTFTLVQPRLRRRKWELRHGDEVHARIRLFDLPPRCPTTAAVPEPDALVMALLAAYLILSRSAAAVAGSTAAATRV
jgi:hypothetical protein